MLINFRCALSHVFGVGTAFRWMRMAGLSRKRKSSFSLSVTLEAVSLCICRRVSSTHSQSSAAVIVLFTKFDALYDDEFAELMSKGVSRKDAQALASQHAKEAFADGPQLKLLYNRKGNQRRPRCHICLPGKSINSAANQFTAHLRSCTFRYGQG
jgi:hypothetical protein